MSKLQKRLDRLSSCPKDYTWDEFCVLMKGLGFNVISGDGSAHCFTHPDHETQLINLHKPHGRNPPTMLIVYVKRVRDRLTEWGYLP